MSTEERFIVFPVTGINPAMVNVLDNIIRGMIQNKFPTNFFKGGVRIDTKTGIRDLFRNSNTEDNANKNGKDENVSRIQKPRILASFNLTDFKTDDTGLGKAQSWQFPATQALKKDLEGYYHFYKDENDLELMTSELRIRVPFDLVFDMSSRDDQLSVVSYLYNILKFQYGYRLAGLRTSFIMPNMMLNGIYNIYYDRTRKKDFIDAFEKRLSDNSSGCIERRKINGEDGRDYFVMNRIYKNLYLQFPDEPQLNDPEKKDNVFDKFSVTISGAFAEMCIPTSYIIKCPDVIGNTCIQENLFLDDDADKKGNVRFIHFGSRPRDLNPVYFPNHLPIHFKMVEKDEIFVDDPVNNIEFDDWLPEDHVKKIKGLSKERVRQIYKIFIYEDNCVLELGTDYFWVDDNPKSRLEVKTRGFELTKGYRVYIMCDTIEYAMLD